VSQKWQTFFDTEQPTNRMKVINVPVNVPSPWGAVKISATSYIVVLRRDAAEETGDPGRRDVALRGLVDRRDDPHRREVEVLGDSSRDDLRQVLGGGIHREEDEVAVGVGGRGAGGNVGAEGRCGGKGGGGWPGGTLHGGGGREGPGPPGRGGVEGPVGGGGDPVGVAGQVVGPA